MAAKKEIIRVQSRLNRLEKEKLKAQKAEERARLDWTKAFHRYNAAALEIVKLKRLNTKKHDKLKKIILAWPNLSQDLTQKRDKARVELAILEKGIVEKKIQKAGIFSQLEAEKQITDEIVSQVFSLNENVVSAAEKRDGYLTEKVFVYLFDENNNLRSQVSFINSDGTRKVVAMVNSIQIVLPEFAEAAKVEIQKFFDRIQPRIEMDNATTALYELTKKLLVEKRSFQVGPDLYRFLQLKLTKKDFPELRNAQDLLKASLRSKKTNTYIRLYERKNTKEKWSAVKQGY